MGWGLMTLDSAEALKPKAYSYLRFSTPEQTKGDSFRRQSQLATDYAARKGLELDDQLVFHDEGVSAFRGANATEGRLAAFLEAVQSSEVARGSILLVESLDRISRDTAFQAQTLLSSIIMQGVTVVTLIDEKEYSLASVQADPMALIYSILTFMRANEESSTKSHRLKAAWTTKRKRMDCQPLTGRVPAWIKLEAGAGQLELVADRVEVVTRIFQDTLAGIGQSSIAAALNLEGVKPWGRGAYWQRSYLAKILASEAVIGAFTPHTLDYPEGKRTRTPQGRIEGYYPAAISVELWNEVRAFSDGKHARARGRHASRPITNMLAGLASCPLCGGTMTRVVKGSRSRPAYVCIRAKSRAGCRYKSVQVARVEAAILERLPVRLRDAPAGSRDPAMDLEILNLEGAMGAARIGIDAMLTEIQKGGGSRAVSIRLRELEGAFEEARDALRELEARRAATAGQTVHARIARLLDALEPKEGDPQVAIINVALQSVFRRVTVDYRHGVLVFDWVHGGDVEVPYALPEEEPK